MTVAVVERSPRFHRTTVEEFLALCETDPGKYKHYELVDGEVWEPVAESDLHAELVERIFDALRSNLSGSGHVVRSHGSIILNHDGMPLPDCFVVRPGEVRDGLYWNGTQLRLAVEVSRTTWATDTAVKAYSYARGQVPVYYAVRLKGDGTAVVHRHENPTDEGYAQITIVPLDTLLNER